MSSWVGGCVEGIEVRASAWLCITGLKSHSSETQTASGVLGGLLFDWAWSATLSRSALADLCARCTYLGPRILLPA